MYTLFYTMQQLLEPRYKIMFEIALYYITVCSLSKDK
jgi:hypothetical protein